VDQVFSNEHGQVDGGLSYPCSSDTWPYGYVCVQYGVLRGEGRAETGIFVVDQQGILRYIDIHEHRRARATDKIMEALDKLR